MILSFGARNFYSFKESFEVDLTLNKKLSNGKGFASSFAIKGSNASGKTNVFKVLSFIKSYVVNSFTNMKPDEDILIESHFANNEPIELFIVFLKNDIEYKYELVLKKQKVISEKFYKKERRWTRIIWRNKNKIGSIGKYNDIKSMKLRDNASFFSSAIQYDIKSINNFVELFNSISTNVHAFGRDETNIDYKTVTEFYYNNNNLFLFVKEILKKSDTGIDDIKIIKSENKETGKNEYFPIFYFKVDEDEKFLTYFSQSSGTKELYLLLGHYKLALDRGTLLAMDEFDIKLHPDLLPMIVDWFEDSEINKNNAQFVFSTHNTEIMDKLGKYKVAFVNKKDNKSFLYRLDEIPGDILRANRPILPVYNTGRIGGKPKIVS